MSVALRETQAEESMMLRCRSGITRVELARLEYCEEMQRTLRFHLRDGTVLEGNGNLDRLCGQLQPETGFLRVHRSYVVNLDYVRNLSVRAVRMVSGAEIPIPCGRYDTVRTAFLQRVLEGRQVVG